MDERREAADVAGRDDVAGLVEAFYRRAFEDDLLGPVFTAARMDLVAHLPVMCDFWETVLFRAGTYQRNALRVHVDLHRRVPLTAGHFERWLALWRATVDDRHAGPKAELAKTQALRIAWSMSRRVLGADNGLATVERDDLKVTGLLPVTRPGAGPIG